jgi:hypothetical protein
MRSTVGTSGYAFGMERPQQRWTLERTAPVRADAEGLFVPATDLPQADVGDQVVVEGHEGGEQRTGTIAETVDRDGEVFFRLDLLPA